MSTKLISGAGALAVLLATVIQGLVPASAATGVPADDVEYGRMILVLDSSGSMKEPASGGTTKIEAARSALDSVISNLPAAADVGLRVFGAKVFSKNDAGACTDSQLVVRPGTANRDALRAAVSSYKPFGETPIGYALRQAGKDIGSEGTRSIVLVSDGLATCEPDPCKVAAELAAQGVDLQINVVGLDVDDKARAQLRCVANAGHGKYFDADSADEIAKSLTTVAERSVRPLELDGKPIRGGKTMSDAVAIRAGVWTDQVDRTGGTSAERWYRYQRTMKGSSVLTGLFSQSQGGFEGMRVEITDSEGDVCDTEGSTGSVNKSKPLGLTVAATPDVDGWSNEKCATGDLLLHVKHALNSDVDTAYRLDVREIPPVKNASTLPEPLDWDEDLTVPTFDVTGTAQEVTPGTSLDDAPLVKPGVYKGDVVPGETQIVKVHVDWGQQLAVSVHHDDAPKANTAFSSATLYNPLGGEVKDDLKGEKSSTFIGARGTDIIGTNPVRWLNGTASTPSSFLAGDYYAVISVGTSDSSPTTTYPWTMKVEVAGDVSGAPGYAEGERVAGGEAAKATGPDKASKSTEEESGAGLKLVVAGGLGLVAVLAGGLALVLMRRGRP